MPPSECNSYSVRLLTNGGCNMGYSKGNTCVCIYFRAVIGSVMLLRHQFNPAQQRHAVLASCREGFGEERLTPRPVRPAASLVYFADAGSVHSFSCKCAGHSFSCKCAGLLNTCVCRAAGWSCHGVTCLPVMPFPVFCRAAMFMFVCGE